MIDTSKASQKCDKLQNPRTSTSTCSTTSWQLRGTSTTDGTITAEICSVTLPWLHIRAKEMISTHFYMNHGSARTNNSAEAHSEQRFSTLHQTRKSLSLGMPMRLLLRNVINVALTSASDGSWSKSITTKLARRPQHSKTSTMEKSLRLHSLMETSTHQASHGRTSWMQELLVQMDSLMWIHTLFSIRDLKTFLLGVMPSEATSRGPKQLPQLSAQSSKITFSDLWKENNAMVSTMAIPIGQC